MTCGRLSHLYPGPAIVLMPPYGLNRGSWARVKVMIPMSNANHNGLAGVRVFVVEDDPLLLMDLESTLIEAGAVVVALCQSLDEAMRRSELGDFAVAVLDFRLGAETVLPFVRELIRRGVPFVLYTGQTRQDTSFAEWEQIAIVEKPAPPHALISAVKQALAG